MARDEQRLRSGIREKSPCTYCLDDEKYTACHDTCKKFEEWRAKLEAVNEARKAYEKLNGWGNWQRINRV